MRVFLTLIVFVMAVPAFARLPYYPIEFPRDDSGHYENVPYPVTNMMEWWYFNGKLTSISGRQLGYFISFNYVYKAPNVMVPLLQLQVTDIDNKKVYSKQFTLSNKNTYHISTTTPLDVRFGNMDLRKNNNTFEVQGTVQSAQGPNLEFSLNLTPKREALLIGGKGLVDMWDDKNSYYYSFTEVATSGYMRIGNELFQLEPQKSLSWMDHQWGDFLVVPGKNQWLWTSIQLENGLDVNMGTIVDKVTKKPVSGSANILMPDNTKVFVLDKDRITFTPHPVQPGHKHPETYDIAIPDIGLNLTLDALAPDQDQNGIWEGISRADGSWNGQPIHGQATSESMIKNN
jgi:predicted secreted hydrolase